MFHSGHTVSCSFCLTGRIFEHIFILILGNNKGQQRCKMLEEIETFLEGR